MSRAVVLNEEETLQNVYAAVRDKATQGQQDGWFWAAAQMPEPSVFSRAYSSEEGSGGTAGTWAAQRRCIKVGEGR